MSSNVLNFADYTDDPPSSGILNRRALYVTTPQGVAQRGHILGDLAHGERMHCPACVAPGFLDTLTPVGHEVAPGAVWYNPYQGWVCTECADK